VSLPPCQCPAHRRVPGWSPRVGGRGCPQPRLPRACGWLLLVTLNCAAQSWWQGTRWQPWRSLHPSLHPPPWCCARQQRLGTWVHIAWKSHVKCRRGASREFAFNINIQKWCTWIIDGPVSWGLSVCRGKAEAMDWQAGVGGDSCPSRGHHRRAACTGWALACISAKALGCLRLVHRGAWRWAGLLPARPVLQRGLWGCPLLLQLLSRSCRAAVAEPWSGCFRWEIICQQDFPDLKLALTRRA